MTLNLQNIPEVQIVAEGNSLFSVSLHQLESGMADLIPSKILPKLDNSTLIDIFLPRFNIESTLPLVETLTKLGMHFAFSPAADFSRMSSENIYVSDVRQKAFIEVNEQGTEAGAVTGVFRSPDFEIKINSVGGIASSPPRTKFRADRPFLFQIVDTYTNFVLFAGCVQHP